MLSYVPISLAKKPSQRVIRLGYVPNLVKIDMCVQECVMKFIQIFYTNSNFTIFE